MKGLNNIVKKLKMDKWIRKMDWYIIKKFLGTYFFAIALIISIAVVFDVNEWIDNFINNKAPIKAIVFDYYANFIPYFSNLFSPLFVFISVIFFTSKLAENSEIIAMMSTGMSFKRLLRPYMISAAIISIMTYGMGAYVIPKGNVTRLNFEDQYKKKKKQEEREARWAELDKRDADKAAAKEAKRLEKERKRKRKALEDAARQAEKDAAALEKFRLKYEKRKAKEDAKAARKSAKSRHS